MSSGCVERSALALLRENIESGVRTLQSLDGLAPRVDSASALVLEALRAGRKLLICGNGGSAAEASHLATEFVSRFKRERRPYPAISLNDFGSTLTAIANDYGAEEVFSRQVRAFGVAGDVLVVFSTSGRSPNVVEALKAATELGMGSVAFLGRSGGGAGGAAGAVAAELATVPIVVASESMARIQEAHQVLLHTVCEVVEEGLVA